MSNYASSSSVSPEKSRAEIERILQRYGATSFAYGWDDGTAVVMFEAHNRRIRFTLPMPDQNDREFTHTPERGTRRSPAQARASWEQAQRQRWRALALVIKAKLEAVQAGIVEFEDEFLAQIVLPDGRTVSDHTRPAIEAAYQTGTLTPMLALGPGE
jgi:hypothetical protein